MRAIVREFVRLCVAKLPLTEPVYEFGSRHVPRSGAGYSDMRPEFPDKKFVGADIQAGDNVDVVLDLHEIDLPASSAGTVLVLDTLEHVEFPRQAIDEVHRILRPEGVLILTTVLNFRIHSQPDYWRFTPEGMLSLLRPFASSLVATLGHPKFPHTLFGVGFKPMIREAVIGQFRKHVAAWKGAIDG